MGIFSKSATFAEFESDIDIIGMFIPNLIFFYTDTLNKNLTTYAIKKYNKKLEFKGPSESNCSSLISFGVIAAGSYFNGQKILTGSDWIKAMDLIKDSVCSTAKMHLNLNQLDELINHFNIFEQDRIVQAKKVIEKHYIDNINNDILLQEEKELIFNEMIPVLEFCFIYISLFIDHKMNQKHINIQNNLLNEYTIFVRNQFEVNTDNLNIFFKSYL